MLLYQHSLNEKAIENKWQCKSEDPDPNEETCDYWNDNHEQFCFWCGAAKPRPPAQGPYR